MAGVLETWRMSFQTVHFLLFLPVAAGIYFVLPGRWRRGWLLAASYYFYFFAAPKYLPVLLAGTFCSWAFGLLIGRAGSPRAKKAWMWTGVGLSVAVLALFKYATPLMERLRAGQGGVFAGGFFVAASALGISYYTFTAIGYLVDVARGEAPAEKNLITYALFLGFFPSVTSGPINRAADLIPQLKEQGRRFEPQNLANALRLIAFGFFKKLAVADMLAVLVGEVYAAPQSYTGLTLGAAAVGFALQLYFDFSGYSDIAIGTAKILGIKLPENFANPYFSTNFSSFWARWHISLSSWLQEYIFTPLVWSRWTEKLPFIGKRVKKPPVFSALLAVFLISGIWHGDTMCFVVWGALQAAYRIGEELLHRWAGKPKKQQAMAARMGKTLVVLVLWVQSLVFFAVGMLTPNGSVGDAVSILWRQFAGISPAQTGRDIYAAYFNGFIPRDVLVWPLILFTLLCLGLAIWADWAQCFRLKGAPVYEGLRRMRPALRWVAYYVLVGGCFAGFMLQSGGFGGASFLYGGF